MQLIIHSTNISLSQQVRRRLASQLDGAFSRTGNLIQRVTLTVKDINGPKGGRDKQCKLELSLAGLPAILVEATQDSLLKSFNHVVRRARNILVRKMKKSQQFRAYLSINEENRDECL